MSLNVIKDCIIIESTRCIDFAYKHLDIPFLYVSSSIINKSNSYITKAICKTFDYHIAYSVFDIIQMKNENRIETFEDELFSFNGDWYAHLKSIIEHEIAHIIERLALMEINLSFPSRIRAYYNIFNYNTRKHHNNLWKKIYTSLKEYQMLNTNNQILIDKDQLIFSYGDC